MRRRLAFSLVELLVVIAIITVLIALIAAGFSRARELARRTACLSNLHQLSLAANSYAAHYRGTYPCDYDEPTGYWCKELVLFDDDIAANIICPDATTGTGAVGTASQAWGSVPTAGSVLSPQYGWLSGTTASYGMNNWIDPSGGGLAALASFNALDFRGNETFNGNVISAVSITSKGGNTFNGNLVSGGTISVNGGGTVNGNQYPNTVGVSPPNVQTIWNQITQYDNPYPTSGSGTIDFTTHPYLIINGSWDANGQITIIGTGTLLVSGNVTCHGQFGANMNIVTLGSVTITGQLNLQGSIYCNGDFTNDGGHNINGVVVVGGTYTSKGNGSFTEATPPPFDPRSTCRILNARTPIFADCNWVDASPQDTDPVPANLQTGDTSLSSNDELGRFCIDRHLGAINVSYLDGSAQTVPLVGLWQQPWSNNFYPTTVTVNASW